MRKCKECGKRVYRGKGQTAWYRWVLRLCGYCYRAKFPKREMWDLPPLRQGSERLLSWGKRRELERYQFCGMERIYWSEDTREQWYDYMEAKERGEIRI